MIPARTSRSCTEPPRTPGHNRQLNLGMAAKRLSAHFQPPSTAGGHIEREELVPRRLVIGKVVTVLRRL